MDYFRFSFAAIAVLALIACNSGTSTGSDVAESSSAAELSSGAVQGSSGSNGASSGSLGLSSSSGVASLSSADGSTSTGAWVYLNPNINYGSLVDERDGQVYKTVVIGTQTWIAQNLNYAVDSSSWCYENSADSCAKYGRLYLWNTAAYFSKDDLSDGLYQGVCPEGWHLPSEAEWHILYNYVDDHNGSEGIATSLKSLNGWNDTDSLLGTDLFGFSALPGGERNNFGSFFYTGLSANFWSSSVSDGYYDPYSTGLDYSSEQVGYIYDSTDVAYSVRCLQD
ncbi:MAG: fibrobacter succinogenes major paralogous domain-containing protein [Fibrobacteraceae bacterium]|nr:fibrobacter succinogenes major paralogous domain-containing protein [Fibrobacteraceae bacterium]